MTVEEAKSLAKGKRVVARYDDGSEHRGEVYSNDASELVITWDKPKGMRTRAPHNRWGHLRREERTTPRPDDDGRAA